MTRQEHILTTIAEECAEVSQRVSKALRFTLDEVQPGQEFNNSERILHEYADLVAMVELAIDEDFLPIQDGEFYKRVDLKKEKFEKFLKLSEERGALIK